MSKFRNLENDYSAGDITVNLNLDSVYIPYWAITDDDTMLTATPTNIPSGESIKAYVDANSAQTLIIDDDTFATATSTNIPSAESVKAYVDTQDLLKVNLTSIIDDDTMLTATSTNIPSAESVKAYVDTQDLLKVNLTSIIDDDTMLTATSTNIPSAESVKAYVDNQDALKVDLSSIINDSTMATASISTIATSQSIKDFILTILTERVPIGTLIYSACNNETAMNLQGYALCDGSEVSKVILNELWDAFGSQLYGTPIDATNHFKLPDYSDCFHRSMPTTGRVLGDFEDSDNKSHTHTGTTASDGSHTHSITDPGHVHATPTRNIMDVAGGSGTLIGYANNGGFLYTGNVGDVGSSTTGITINSGGSHTHTFTTGADGSTQARPKNMVVYTFIKARWGAIVKIYIASKPLNLVAGNVFLSYSNLLTLSGGNLVLNYTGGKNITIAGGVVSTTDQISCDIGDFYLRNSTTPTNYIKFVEPFSQFSAARSVELPDKTGVLSLVEDVETAIAPITPVGCIIMFASTTLPYTYLHCDGSALDTTNYWELFAKIGYNFGGSGSTFLLPNTAGIFVRGWDYSAGGFDPDAPRAIGSFQQDALQSHIHDIDIYMKTMDYVIGGIALDVRADTGVDNTTVVSQSGRSASESRPVNICLPYIIRYATDPFYLGVAPIVCVGLSVSLDFDTTLMLSSGALVMVPYTPSTNISITSYTISTTDQIDVNIGDFYLRNSTTPANYVKFVEPFAQFSGAHSVELPNKSGIIGCVDDVETAVAAIFPIGSIIMYASTTPPPGWFICDGTICDNTVYPELFAKIGYNFGGSGINFSLPDTGGLFVRGWDSSAGGYDPDAPRAIGSIQNDALQSHIHDVNIYMKTMDYTIGGTALDTRADTGVDNTQTTGQTARFDEESRPVNICLPHIIRYI